MAPRLIAVLLVAGLVAACASTGSTGSRNRNLISIEEISASQTTTAYDLIRQLRPHFLRTSGPTSINAPSGPEIIVVYLDGTRMGGPEALHGIPTTDVKAVQFLSASQATTRYGTGHTQGAIVVTTR